MDLKKRNLRPKNNMRQEFKPIDIKKLEACLRKKDFDSAQKMLADFFIQEIPAVEKGKIYADIISLYLSITKKINVEYEHTLKETLETLKSLDKEEKKTFDMIRTAEIKATMLLQDEEF